MEWYKLFNFSVHLTDGAFYWKYFTINGVSYLALSNFYNDLNNTVDSKIYKWNGAKFIEFQNILTYGSNSCESFCINDETYLAFANKFSNSQIYKWDGTSFKEFQTIPSNSAMNMKPFIINDYIFLAVANSGNENTFNINSQIYQWNGTSFTEFQTIDTNCAQNFESFIINGETYLAVANHHNDITKKIDTKIYKWNCNLFKKFQTIPTEGAVKCKTFIIDDVTYLAIANFNNDSTYQIESKIYKWKDMCNYTDSDSDGVIDKFDTELNTPKGSAVYANGQKAIDLYDEIEDLKESIAVMYTEKQLHERLQSILDCCDTDGNGKISLLEIIKGLETLSGIKE